MNGNEVERLRAAAVGRWKGLGHRVRMAADALARLPRYRPGHYYSPIPSLAEVEARAAAIFAVTPPAHLPGVDLRTEEKLALVDALVGHVHDHPFADEPVEGVRHWFGNPFFGHGDGCGRSSSSTTVSGSGCSTTT